jgi:outer membrane protein assembly factor BamB
MLKRRKQVTGEAEITNAQTGEPAPRKPLRLWPGVVLAVLQILSWYVVPRVLPEKEIFGMMGTVIAGFAIVVWWAFFSRAPRLERWGAVLLMIVALAVTSRLLHVSVSNAGQGMLFVFLAIPLLSFVFVIGVAASHRLAERPRRALLLATILLASGGWALVRIDGINPLEVAWRWSPTSEERLLANEPFDSAQGAQGRPAVLPSAPATTETSDEQRPVQTGVEPAALRSTPVAAKTHDERSTAQAGDEPAALRPAPAAVETVAEWPGFRGAGRNGIIPGVRIETDWSASPPVELWRRPIGPGWSSFAVRGDLLYTQEQRGDYEIVACYNVKTGAPVWMHSDSARFWEANAGPGPRATPTLSNGRVYTFGATGIVNALDAANGAVVWSRNGATDAGAKAPYWGFASSPLVVDDVVIVAASGALIAYDLATGDLRWSRPDSSVSYSSPQLVTIDGVAQVLLLSKGVTSVAPAGGKVLWEHAWPGFTMVQPARTVDGDILITDEGLGMRRLAVTHGTDGWSIEERWTSNGLKPYFNDYVVHQGHAFGFDGSILACIDLADGKRKWKGGRYGNGQLVLLADQDVLLVLSDQGELVLVAATPDQFKELARFPAIKGKTWNHPVLVGDVLVVRNGQEMAAFRLSLAGD